MVYRGSRPLIPVSIATARKSLSRSRTSMHGSSRPHSPCQPNRIGAFNPGPEIEAEPLVGPISKGPFAMAGPATQSIAPAANTRNINRLPMPRLLGPGPLGSTSPFHPPYTAGRRTVPPPHRAGAQNPAFAFSGRSFAASFRAPQISRNSSAAYAGGWLFTPPIAPRSAVAVTSIAFSNNVLSISPDTVYLLRLADGAEKPA